MDRTRRWISAYRAGRCLRVTGEGKIDRPALPGNTGGIKERPTMAEIPRKDRAAIKSDIALSRDRMARELSGLRYELDIPRKIKNSFRDQTATWIGALAAVGLLIAIAPGGRVPVAAANGMNIASKENAFAAPRCGIPRDGARVSCDGSVLGCLRRAGLASACDVTANPARCAASQAGTNAQAGRDVSQR